MDNLTLIKETNEYSIFTSTYNGTMQKFRRWHHSQLIEVAFTNDFARANGYDSISDMLDKEPDMKLRLNTQGGIPDWIQIINGNFYVEVRPKMCLN